MSRALDRDPGGRGEVGRRAGSQGGGTGVQLAGGQLWLARGDGWGRWPECDPLAHNTRRARLVNDACVPQGREALEDRECRLCKERNFSAERGI